MLLSIDEEDDLLVCLNLDCQENFDCITLNHQELFKSDWNLDSFPDTLSLSPINHLRKAKD